MLVAAASNTVALSVVDFVGAGLVVGNELAVGN